VAFESLDGDVPTLAAVSAAGGDPELLCRNCRVPTGWSPDAKSLIWEMAGNRGLVLTELASGKKTEILKHPKYGVSRARFSPDARWLSFHVILGPEARRIYVTPFRGAVLHDEKDWIPITDGQGAERYADWSPDAKNLAVVRAVDGRFRLEYPLGRVLYEAAGWITYPRVSPMGDRIAFLDHPTLGENDGSVAVVDLDGHKTTLSSGWKNLKGLAWSAKGDEVWFSADHLARSQMVYAVTLSGHEHLVLQAPGWMRLQEVSRDGRVLLLQASPRSRIVFQPPGASSERNLSWFDWSTVADLSADGRKLLFYEWGEGVAGNPTVYLRDTNGADAVRLGEGRALALSPALPD